MELERLAHTMSTLIDNIGEDDPRFDIISKIATMEEWITSKMESLSEFYDTRKSSGADIYILDEISARYNGVDAVRAAFYKVFGDEIRLTMTKSKG